MADTPKQEIKLFYCYARKDKPLRDELEIQLSWLKRHYRLTNWHDREILPREEWEQAIDRHLNTAHLIFLLISPDFMASDYCYSKEMQRALERHNAGSCRVVPILLRPTYWEDAPFSSLQLLPTNARPITSWPNSDKAFQDVVKEISRTIKDLLISLKTKEVWLKEGIALYNLKRYEEALAAYDQAIRLDPNYAYAYYDKGLSLYNLKRYEEALIAFDRAIRLDPNYADAYTGRGAALYELKRCEEALTILDQAIRLDPNSSYSYTGRGDTLYSLKRYEEALTAYDQAIRLDPNFVDAYIGRDGALGQLKRYEEALAAYDQAIRLDPNSADAHNNRGLALRNLKRDKEATQAFEKARQLGYGNP